jgi:alpha-L-fucosidase 2
MRAPWSSNYTVNINTEMNYWMAESCNLGDCHTALFELIDRTVKKGKITAQKLYGLEGWVSHHNIDIWGNSDPVGKYAQDGRPCQSSSAQIRKSSPRRGFFFPVRPISVRR